MNLKLFKEERRKKGYSQQYMAEQLGFKDKSSYCLIEKGKIPVTVDLANKIAAVLDFNKKRHVLFFTHQKFKKLKLTSTWVNHISSEGKNKWELILQKQLTISTVSAEKKRQSIMISSTAGQAPQRCNS